jgi:hypothetical protein
LRWDAVCFFVGIKHLLLYAASEGSGVLFGHASIVITLGLYGSPVEGLMD